MSPAGRPARPGTSRPLHGTTLLGARTSSTRSGGGTIALGRVGEADDIGAALPALLSGALGWANGTRFELSGGQNL